jgi:hypothetical protein
VSKLSVSKPGSLDDQAVSSIITDYRVLVAQRYTPCQPVELSRYLSSAPFLTSRKIDGELWFLDTTEKEPRLIASNGRVASGEIAILTEAKALPKNQILVGELYVSKAGRERVGDVAKALAKAGEGLSFAAFDLILSDGKTWQASTYLERLEALRSMVPSSNSALTVAETTQLASESEVIAYFNDTVTKGGSEGIIVRCQDGRILKIKQSISVDAVILAFTTELGKSNEEQVRSVLLGLALPDGSFIAVGASGNFDASFSQQNLLKVLLPLEVESSYRQAAASGQLYRFVKPEVILETLVIDVQVSDSQNRRLRQPKLRLEKAGWTAELRVPAASLLNAVVVRERNDKPDVQSGARWEQIVDYAEVPTAAVEALPASEVVRRQVWSKTSADKVDVRKLVVFKTNKELVEPLYPAFVVHWTDFSSTRKAPLAREVKPAPDLASANEIADGLIADNIKKGWEPVETKK